jgi:hypothetical protein
MLNHHKITKQTNIKDPNSKRILYIRLPVRVRLRNKFI